MNASYGSEQNENIINQVQTEYTAAHKTLLALPGWGMIVNLVELKLMAWGWSLYELAR